MRLLRKHPEPEVIIDLDELLEPYTSATVPAADHQAIAALPCDRCGKPIVYAVRSTPGRCPWCEVRLRIDLEREELARNGSFRRARRR